MYAAMQTLGANRDFLMTAMNRNYLEKSGVRKTAIIR